MNIEQVNRTLDRALLGFHEDTEEALMSVVLDEDDDEQEEVVEASDKLCKSEKKASGKGDDDEGDDDEGEEQDEALEATSSATEEYTGVGGTDPVDHSPTGDAETGDVGGVDNYSHEMEAFLSFIVGIVDDCAGIGGYDYDAVMNGLEALTQEMAKAGEIPPMPNPEVASAEELSGWCLAATTAGLAGRLAEYMKAYGASE